MKYINELRVAKGGPFAQGIGQEHAADRDRMRFRKRVELLFIVQEPLRADTDRVQRVRTNGLEPLNYKFGQEKRASGDSNPGPAA